MKTGNKAAGILTALLLIVLAMQGVIIVRLCRPEQTQAQPKQNDSQTQLNFASKAGETPPSGTASRQSPQPPVDPLNGLGLDPHSWDPLQEFHTMRQRMNQLFNDSFGRLQMSPDFDSLWGTTAFSPSMDVEEKDGRYVIRMDIPGADKSNISVDVSDREITVSGTVDETVEEQTQNQLRKERRSGRFSRSFTLPGPVKADEMEAEYKNGVLVITVPKADKKGAETRSIEVK